MQGPHGSEDPVVGVGAPAELVVVVALVGGDDDGEEDGEAVGLVPVFVGFDGPLS